MRKLSQKGSVLIEFSLSILPLMGLLLFTVDVAWSIFARATLQNAVRQGVRFGVTGRTLPGTSCLGSSVQQIVAQSSFGFIPANRAASFVAVSYYLPTDLSQVSGAGATAGGNVIQVSITNVAVKSFGPLLRSATPISLSASASDVLESPPNGVAPCP